MLMLPHWPRPCVLRQQPVGPLKQLSDAIDGVLADLRHQGGLLPQQDGRRPVVIELTARDVVLPEMGLAGARAIEFSPVSA
jgi:hypothetical protein